LGKRGLRFFIEFTDNPYGYEITYCGNTLGMWEKIVEAIDDDTGLKMCTVMYKAIGIPNPQAQSFYVG